MTLLRFGKRVCWGCWYSLAGLLVLCALLISLARSLLPQLDGARDHLVVWLQEQTGIQFEVAQLGAGWHGGGPRLQLKQLALPPEQDLPVSFTIQRMELHLDFWNSVFSLTPQFNEVSFYGVTLDLSLGQGSAGGTNTAALEQLREVLLQQLGRLNIEDVTVQVAVKDHQFAPIHLTELNWRNRGHRHLGEGLISLDQGNEALMLALELNSQDNGELQGRAYLQGQRLPLGQWLSRRLEHNPYDYSGELDLEAWLSLDGDGIHLAQIQLDNSNFSWQLDGEQRMAVQTGRFQWRPMAEGGELRSHGLQLTSNGQAWPESQLALRHGNGELDLYLSELPLWGLQPLLGLVPGIGAEPLKALTATEARGTLGPLKLQHRDDQWRWQLPFDQLGWDAAAGIPGVDALSGSLTGQDDWLRLTLPTQALSLDWPGQFEQPLALNELGLTAEWLGHGDGRQLRIPSLTLATPELTAQLQSALAFSEDAAPQLQLYGNLAIQDAGQVAKLYPRKAMGESLADYLDKALQAGETNNAQLLWHGPLDQYPYAQQQGRFQAGFEMTGVHFDFLDEWPAVTDGRLLALFENDRMDLRVREAKLADVLIEDIFIGIPHLNHSAALEIQGSLMADEDKARSVLTGTFLESSVLGTLDSLKLMEPVPLALDMTFYLGRKVTHQPDSVKGRLVLWETPLYIAPLDLELEQVRGELRFHNAKIEARNVQTRIYNQPTELNLHADREETGYGINIDLSSRWQTYRLPPLLQTPLDPFLSGGAPLDAKVALNLGDNGFHYRLEVNSELTGLEIDLPAPLGKALEQPRPTQLALSGDTEGAEVFFHLGDSLRFVGDMSYASGAGFDRYHLALDRAEPTLPEYNTGLISLRSERIEMDDYQPLISAFAEAPPRPARDKRPLYPAIDKIQVDSEDLRVLGQSLGAGRLVASPNRDGWGLRIDAERVAGQALVGQGMDQLGVQFNADYLVLTRSEQSEQTESRSIAPALWLDRVPALDVHIAKLRLDQQLLGEARFMGFREGPLYRVQSFELSQDEHRLAGSGVWQPDGELTQTRFEGQLTSPDIGDLAEHLTLGPGIEDAELAVDYQLSWEGAPWELSADRLDGALSYQLSNGQLSSVSDRGARLLSLFSLESLVRKISLDFSDVFASGMHFSDFSGNVQFDDGVLSTEDSVMDATAGTLRVAGWTDLNDRSLEYEIAFSPALASSVPAVVYLSTGAWTVGLGAFAVTKLLEPVIEVVTQLRYHLTGTLDQPELVEVSRTSREVRIPEEAQTELGQEAAEAQAEQLQEALIEAIEEQSMDKEAADAGAPAADEQPTGISAKPGADPTTTGEAPPGP
ncbi:YhdP family protein [Ferrimonas marina]|uniref:YhdP family protein n=1 Tax=Ferrimonas marina TaxID=299255 RepID=UPI0008296345|nr:YhdP family protein [Ferrimonas marina]